MTDTKPPRLPRQPRAAYDPAVIQQIADDLYSEADAIVSAATTRGVLGGGVLGLALGMLFMSAGGQAGDGAVGALLIWIVIFGAGGYAMVIGPARRQALQLRYQAQLALCQMRTELNTRREG